MADRLAGKVAIVTGGGRGIGRSIAETFAREGARVVVADVSGDEMTAAAEIGLNATAFNVDISDGPAVEAMVRYAVDTYGRLDVLCANAGIDGDMQPCGEATEANFDRVIAVNLRGTFLCDRYAIPAMLATGGGSIIHIASIAGIVAFPAMGAYGASKAAVIQLARVIAHEYGAAGIRANAICPGVIDTPMLRQMPKDVQDQVVSIAAAKTAMPQLGSVADIANAALFLASDDSVFVTGTDFKVDGGWTAA